MLVYPGVGPLIAHPRMRGGRGPFVGSPGAWRWALDETPFLAGPVCPVAAAEGSYSITVDLAFDVPPAADLTRWGGVYFGVATDDCPDDVDTATGYLAALRWNGELEVSRQPPDGSGMASLGSTVTPAVVPPVLSGALRAGVEAGSLPVTATRGALPPGSRFVLPTGQVARLSAPAAGGATSLPIDDLTPTAAVPAGTPLPQLVTLTIAKTPTGVTVSRDGTSATYADSTWSGGYVFLRNSRDDVAAVSCAGLTISSDGTTMPKNVVIHEHMGDPAGYSIAYDAQRRFLVTRLVDGAEIGRYDTRVEALAAAQADRDAHTG
jgi:hypothetical protein